MSETPKLPKGTFSTKDILIASIIFLSFFIIASSIFITFDIFERIYEVSREHEDWELDEIILTFIALFISLSISLFFLSFRFGKKVLILTKKEIEQQKKIQANKKLQYMGSMLGGLSHSINNHLVPIITLSKIIKEDTPKNSPNYEDISKILEASYGLKDIVKQVLNYTRKDNNQLVNSCFIDETINNCLNLIKTTIPSSISFETQIEKTSLIIPISKVNIEVIIFNLITNAIHALENKKNGIINISLKLGENNIIEIKIRDNGSGISKENKELIFDPFFTTKEQGKGTGLGLSETFGIISNAGGKISVDSKENEFTEFTLIIPSIKEYK
ncbi:HAMP domain-containing sensor histidine kinase [Halarcobacter sp.]|uniref:sensor histidine kinase n=1 Tax=Halarcobacter sp. TaxID=2321133 RepID=UPI0029F4CCF6|nr:HAMP domain-containing sensor histidine kinase [Halarcobacter sp.]